MTRYRDHRADRCAERKAAVGRKIADIEAGRIAQEQCKHRERGYKSQLERRLAE